MFVLVHLYVLCPVAVAHPICVFLSLANDTHIIGPTLNVVLALIIAGRVFNIRAFSAVNEMCSLVSIRVGPFYIISF